MSRSIAIKIILAILALALLAALFKYAGPPAVVVAQPGFGEKTAADIKSPGSEGRVVLVLVDYLQLKDLGQGITPHLDSMAGRGAVALMNANTGRSIIPENTYATIGAGAHAMGAYGLPGQTVDFKSSGKAGEAEQYLQRTGVVPPLGSLFYIDISRMNMLNERLDYSVKPGQLGEIVREAGYRTAALGNSDDLSGPKRQVLTVVMDTQGIVDTGFVGEEVTRREREFFGGSGTDYNAILERYKALPRDVKLVAIDLGDLARLQGARELMSAEHWKRWRSVTLARTDQFLGRLIDCIDVKNDLVVLVSPTPGDNGAGKDKMSPVIFYGGGVSGGLLVSPTTKRPGVIMNVDIAPSVISFLGLSGSENITGRPVMVLPGDYGLNTISAMYGVIDQVYESRPYLQKLYVILQLVLLAVSLGYIFLKKKGKDVLKPYLVAVMSVPLAYLLLPLFPPAGMLLGGLLLLLITAGLTWISLAVNKRLNNLFVFISIATMAVIATDILAGSPLQKVSIMSYDPVVGARFYGLGNEYMGVLIGATLLGTTALIPAGRRRLFYTALAGAFYLFVIYIIAAPQQGTNVGGTIAAAGAFLVTFLLLCGVRLTWKRIFTVAAAVFLLVLALTLYDSARPPQYQSHIGRTAGKIGAGGISEIISIINRKSEINIKLIKYTIWSRIFLSSLGMLALLFYKPPGVMEGIRARQPYLFKGLVGVITGSIVAFIFNDSGVVAAATTMIFGAPPLIYMVLEELEGINAEKV